MRAEVGSRGLHQFDFYFWKRQHTAVSKTRELWGTWPHLG